LKSPDCFGDGFSSMIPFLNTFQDAANGLVKDAEIEQVEIQSFVPFYKVFVLVAVLLSDDAQSFHLHFRVLFLVLFLVEGAG